MHSPNLDAGLGEPGSLNSEHRTRRDGVRRTTLANQLATKLDQYDSNLPSGCALPNGSPKCVNAKGSGECRTPSSRVARMVLLGRHVRPDVRAEAVARVATGLFAEAPSPLHWGSAPSGGSRTFVSVLAAPPSVAMWWRSPCQ